MDRWVGKVALVTGASAGIGAAITEELAKAGLKVFGLARRVEKIEELKKNVGQVKGEIIPIKGDVRNENEVLEVFKTIKEKFGAIHILVNNAGLARHGLLSEMDSSLYREVFDVNVLALINCSQQALKLMKEAKVDDGHIIHINSIAGHKIPSGGPPKYNVYPATKHAVTVLTESMRAELVYLKSKIKITSVSPGVVESEFRQAAAEGSGLDASAELQRFTGWPMLKAKDVADTVLFAISTPPHVQIHEIIVKPIGETL